MDEVLPCRPQQASGSFKLSLNVTLDFVQDPERGTPTLAHLQNLTKISSWINIYHYTEYVQMYAHNSYTHFVSEESKIVL